MLIDRDPEAAPFAPQLDQRGPPPGSDRRAFMTTEGGCQAEIGVAPAMGAAMMAQACAQPPLVIGNAPEGALEHQPGMTCDPAPALMQIPSIERCAFGAVKSWTASLIAKVEAPPKRGVDLNATVQALAITAGETNWESEETSEGGLAVSRAVC